jgi:hypothetical protein
MKSATRVSPEAMNIFLRQAALEDQWTLGYLEKALGLNRQTAQEIATEMTLVGGPVGISERKDDSPGTRYGGAR